MTKALIFSLVFFLLVGCESPVPPASSPEEKKSPQKIAEVGTSSKNRTHVVLPVGAKKVRKESLEDKVKARALPEMLIKTDPKTGTSWYKDKNTPRHNDINNIYLYIEKKRDKQPTLRLRIRYCNDEWLNIMSYLLLADGKRYLSSTVRFKRLRGPNSFQELYDEPITANTYAMIEGIIRSQRATMRFHGQKGTADFLLSSSQKLSMKHVLAAFNQMHTGHDAFLLKRSSED